MSTRSSTASSAEPQPPRHAARAALRGATAEHHRRLDALFAGFDLASRDSYARFLAAHAAALFPLEARFTEEAVATPRSAALRADLAALGQAAPPPLDAPDLTDPARRWGAAYVVEGSRLGGALLARSVGEGLPRTYLAAPQPPGAWRSFLGRLDAALANAAALAAAIEAAQETFALFERSGRRELGLA